LVGYCLGFAPDSFYLVGRFMLTYPLAKKAPAHH
jgi:hypothetical protein